MSKKMKRGSLESSSYVVSEDAKARLKHQTLFQDYQELNKETDDMRNTLEDAKMRKQRLLAEVNFLRRRHRYLLQMKASSSHPVEQERNKNGMKDRSPSKKETKLYKLPPLPGPKQKGKIHVSNEAALQKMPPDFLANHKQAVRTGKDAVSLNAVSNFNHKLRVYTGKETPFRKTAPVFDLNQNSRSSTPMFDLNQDTSHGGKDFVLPSRAPVIDLNEISMGDEEAQTSYEPLNFEVPKSGLITNLNDEQHGDLKLSVCRNLGEGTARVVGKRKISWQDPVALRV